MFALKGNYSGGFAAAEQKAEVNRTSPTASQELRKSWRELSSKERVVTAESSVQTKVTSPTEAPVRVSVSMSTQTHESEPLALAAADATSLQVLNLHEAELERMALEISEKEQEITSLRALNSALLIKVNTLRETRNAKQTA